MSGLFPDQEDQDWKTEVLGSVSDDWLDLTKVYIQSLQVAPSGRLHSPMGMTAGPENDGHTP